VSAAAARPGGPAGAAGPTGAAGPAGPAAVAGAAGPAGPTGPAGSIATTRWLRRVRWYLPAVLVFVGTIALWELVVQNIDLRGLPLPAPSEIAGALSASWGAGRWPIGKAAAATLFEALGGLAIGTVAGVVVAGLTARFVTARELLLPIAIGASAVPIIAFAPLMNNWFGVLNPLSKMMIVAVLVFFPVVVNVTRGLTSVEPAALELMRSYAASDWSILWRVRVPNALPYFFTALKVGSTLALIGAIVGEYFGGSSDVLGRVIVQSASALRFDVTWAAIVVGAVSGIVSYLAIAAVERIVIPWHASMRAGEP
jgi:NitT/TauT family transport system permease protein